ncbi:MAG: N-acetylmuramic acid 6-phosphate etherase [Planctomycetes bacterium]|nr:N-acetylmuramic acid 6-phosphate etherase [Planctomycetota bacterium]
MRPLATEAVNPASAAIDSLDAWGIVGVMVAEDARVAPAVAREAEAIARAIDAIAARLRAGGRLVYQGAGTSGRLGVLDASECPPTFSTPPEMVVGLIAGGPTALTRAIEGAEDRPELAVADLDGIGFGPGDVLVGIATSGRTPYVLGGIEHARRRGAFTIGVACSPDSALAAAADLAIVPLVGPEVIAGSTRLKAGTATKLVLNMLSTGAMILLGKTYGNLMVDLRATNSKLLDRSRRIAARLTGVDDAAATELLVRHDGELKTAIVAARRGVSTMEARRLLAAAGGQLRGAIGTDPVPRPTAASPDLVIGVDGGGSGCRAVVGRVAAGELTVLGRGSGGPANPRAIGGPAAAANIRAAVVQAFAAAGVPAAPAARACLGLAGAGRTDDAAAVAAALADVATVVTVVTDADLLLGDAAPGAVVALIAGTGSIAVARAADGTLDRAGGWGAVFGDEGSGWWVGREALAAVTAAADGRGRNTALTARLLSRYGVDRPGLLAAALSGPALPRDRVAAAAIDVVAAAAAGDGVAVRILEAAATELAALVLAVERRRPVAAAPWCLRLAGGLLVHAPSLADAVTARLRQEGRPPARVEVVADAALEAARMARRAMAPRRDG